MMWCIESIP